MINKKVLLSAEQDMAAAIKRFSRTTITDKQAEEYAKQAVSGIDWKDSALMHKGINWMAKRFIAGMS